jgi:hypothetical protein
MMDNGSLALLIPLIAICLPVVGLAIILGFVLMLRYFRLKETELMLSRGVAPEQIIQERANRPSRGMLFGGIVVAMIGLALTVAMLPIGFVTHSPFPLGLGPWMIVGLVPLFVGLGLILWHYLANSPDKRGNGE